VVSPDDKWVGTVDMDGNVSVWDARSGRRVRQFKGAGSGEGCLAFSPDGKYLATGSRFVPGEEFADYRIRLWDLKTGKQTGRYAPQKGAIHRLAFSPDGGSLISGGLYQPVNVWKIPGARICGNTLPGRIAGG
jgi:WD40 repeat protein